MTPFEELVAEHGAAVLRVARALVGPDLADDVWSETFLAALTAYPQTRPERPGAWLCGIARHKAVDAVRAQARTVPTAEVPERATPGPGGPAADLWEAVATLPEKQRLAVVHHHIAGLPHADVAELLGGTPAAARKAASDGVAALRRVYRPAPADRPRPTADAGRSAATAAPHGSRATNPRSPR